MDKVTLLPCPFCGAEAQLEHGSDHHGGWFNLGCSRHWGSGLVDPDDGCIGGRIFYTETETPEAEAITAWNTRATPAPDSEKLREALEQGRPFSEWHEDHGDVLWWKLPIVESPYCGSPIDLGRSMKVVVQIGFEEHDLPITMTGGWPFSDDDEQDLWWTPLPKPTFYRAGASA